MAEIAAKYNGTNDHARRYGERINAQLNNSNYNKNIVADQLKKFIKSFTKSK